MSTDHSFTLFVFIVTGGLARGSQSDIRVDTILQHVRYFISAYCSSLLLYFSSSTQRERKFLHITQVNS